MRIANTKNCFVINNWLVTSVAGKLLMHYNIFKDMVNMDNYSFIGFPLLFLSHFLILRLYKDFI